MSIPPILPICLEDTSICASLCLLDGKMYYGGWSGGRLAEKLRSSCTEEPWVLQSSSGQGMPSSFSVRLLTWFFVLSFFSWAARKEDQTSWRKAWPMKEETGAAKDCTWRKGIYGVSVGAGICFDWRRGGTMEQSYVHNDLDTRELVRLLSLLPETTIVLSQMNRFWNVMFPPVYMAALFHFGSCLPKYQFSELFSTFSCKQKMQTQPITMDTSENVSM